MNNTTISVKSSNTSLVESYSKSKDSEIPSKYFYQYGTKKIEYFVVRSKRRKTSEVIVDSDEILFRVPYSKPIEEIQRLLDEKIKWILRKQKEISENERKTKIVKPDFSEKTTLPYLGQNYQVDIKIVNSEEISESTQIKEDTLELLEDRFVLTIYSKSNIKDYNIQNKNEILKSLYEKWLYKKAESIFKEKISILSKTVNVKPKKVVIKNLKNRWGSVSKNETINLNMNLVKTPEDIIDYIIIHELCHFKIKGHSFKFWNYLKQFVPDYNRKRKWLEQNNKNILTSY